MRGERGEEREGQREGWREREDIEKETLACLHIPSTDSRAASLLHVMTNQSRRRNNLIWNKAKVSAIDR